MKKLISIITVALFSVILLAGCSQQAAHRDELKQAFNNIPSWTSFSSNIAINMTMTSTTDSASNQDISITGTLDNNNKKGHLTLTIPAVLAASAGVSNVDIYYETTDTSMVLYMNTGNGWKKSTTPVTDNTIISPTASIDVASVYSPIIDNTNYVSDETIDSTDCYKYEVTLKWDILFEMLQKAIDSNPTASQELESSATTISLIKAQFAAYSPLKLTLWVDKANLQIKQTLIDATDTLKSVNNTANQGVTSSITITKLNIQMKYSNINSAPEIVIPSAAKDAAESSLMP